MKERSILTIGNFDGVHLGHHKLLSVLVDFAKQRGSRSVVLSYTDHPAFILEAHPLPKVLCPAEYKKRQLHNLGIDEVELLSFNVDFAKITANSFLRDYIMPVWNPELIIVGYDSHFGYQRKGDYHFLKQYRHQYCYEVEYVQPLLYNGDPVSSSMIRNLLLKGDIDTANKLLAKPYRLFGEVGHGIGKGESFEIGRAHV